MWVIVPLGIAVWLMCLIFHPFEPRYEGKRLSAWARDISFPNWPGEVITNEPTSREISDKHDQATTAIRQIGIHALPCAVKWCRARDSWLKDKLETCLEDRNWGIHFVSAQEKNEIGIIIIHALGPMAKPAIPDLFRMLQSKDNMNVASYALAGIGPDAIPPLTDTLTNANPRVRMCAATGLGCLGPQARQAEPALLQCLKDEDHFVQERAAHSLGLIGGNPATIVPALVQCLEHETDAFGSTLIIATIARFGTNARPAIPALIKIIESKRIVVAGHALGALRKIDPDAARPYFEKWEAGTAGSSQTIPSPAERKISTPDAYTRVVKRIYMDAWQPDERAVAAGTNTLVAIVIARDGKVLSAKIIATSGNLKMDNSVQKALDRVKSVYPFETGASDEQRTFTICFNLKEFKANEPRIHNLETNP